MEFVSHKFHAGADFDTHAANAEIDAMAELDGKDIAELVRLTTLFSEQMETKFQGIKEEQ